MTYECAFCGLTYGDRGLALKCCSEIEISPRLLTDGGRDVDDAEHTHYCRDCELKLSLLYDERRDESVPIVCGHCGGTNTQQVVTDGGRSVGSPDRGPKAYECDNCGATTYEYGPCCRCGLKPYEEPDRSVDTDNDQSDDDLVTDGGQDVDDTRHTSGDEWVYMSPTGDGGTADTYHTDRDCDRLRRDPHRYKAENIGAKQLCEICSGESEPSRTGPNGPWQVLEDANPDDLVTDGGRDDQEDQKERPLYVDFCEECEADRVHFKATKRCQTCHESIRPDGDGYLWGFDDAEWTVPPFEGYDRSEIIPELPPVDDDLVTDGGQSMGESEHPEWEVGIRAWGPDDEPGEARWEHYHPRAPDEETAKEKAVEEATTPGINAIIGISDAYEVYQVAGPFEDNRSVDTDFDRQKVIDE